MDGGYRHVKLKFGADLDDDVRRPRIAREVIGWDAHLMIDANQVWDVPQAIELVGRLAEFKPLGSMSRPVPTTSSGMRPFAESSHRSASPRANTA